MALLFADLKKGSLNLKPVEVPISGLLEPLLIHQFSAAQMSVVMAEPDGESVDLEALQLTRLMKFLNGFDYEQADGDREILMDNFASWQIREIYQKALKLNGFGPDALREAEKN